MKQDYEEFLKLLESIPIRCNYKRDKPCFLKNEELQEFCLLSKTKGMEDACHILQPLFKKYRDGSNMGKRTMPELIIKGIYFIIFRELTDIYLKDLDSEPRYRKLLERDKNLRRRVFPKCSNRVFQLLGEKNCKLQSRMGIQPLKDFTMLYYEPVRLHPSGIRDMLFRELMVNILYQSDYSMFIDLSGEDTILQDFYYCDKEVIYCNDSVSANFYYVLQTRYKLFCEKTKAIVKGLHGDINDLLYKYRQNLENMKLYDIKDFYSEYPQERKNESDEYHEDFKKPFILTYPLSEEYANEDLAYQWMIVLLGKKFHWKLEDLKKHIDHILDTDIRWLQMRISKAIIAWGGVTEFLSAIQDSNVGFLSLPYKGALIRIPSGAVGKKKYLFYENSAKRSERKMNFIQDRHNWVSKEDAKGKCDKVHIDNRVRKGFLFYDYTIARRDREVLAFQRFAKENECLWAFVCRKEDIFWIEQLCSDKQKSRKIIRVNEDSEYGQYLRVAGYCLDTVIVTNAEVRKILYERFRGLQTAFPMDDPAKWEKTILLDNWDSWKRHITRGEYEE